MTKEFKVAERIRKQSERVRAKRDGESANFGYVSTVKKGYESKGEWGKHCPFDHELENTINGLENILSYVGAVLENATKDVPALGTKKKAKDNSDLLVWGLCHIYKEYTGKIPISWNAETSANSTEQPTNIITFLQFVLPHTSYRGGQDRLGQKDPLSSEALQKKILRFKRSNKYPDLWMDSKD